MASRVGRRRAGQTPGYRVVIGKNGKPSYAPNRAMRRHNAYIRKRILGSKLYNQVGDDSTGTQVVETND